VPEGVTYLTAITTGGGQGGGPGGQTIRSKNGDALVGSGGRGGEGGMTSYTRFTVSGGQSLTFVVGAGGDAPVETDSDQPTSSYGALGSSTYITTSLFFGTTKARASGGGASTSGTIGYRNQGGDGGFNATYVENLSSPDSAVSIYMGAAGGGGGAGGYGNRLSDFFGQGGDASTTAPGEDGNPTFGILDGRGGGGGGGCPDIYKMQTASPKEFVPKTAGNGGGIFPYGTVWKPEMPIAPNTRVQVNGDAGAGAFSSTGSQGYDAANGGTGSRALGGRTSWNAGAGGAGNSFKPFRPSGGTYARQDSRLYGGAAGGPGQIRIFWGNERISYYRDIYAAGSTTSTLETSTYPSAFHTRVGHEASHIIILNPKEINHWG
jgi:hypothetical protein